MRGPILATCLLALVGYASRAQPQAALPGAAAQVVPLAVGARAPEVELQTVDGAPFELGPFIAKHPVVLIFYRGGW